MNPKDYKKLVESIPVGVAVYDGKGELVFANRNAKRISRKLFPKKFKDLNLIPKEIRNLNAGRTVFHEESLYYQLCIKPIKKMGEGCVILAQDTSNKNGIMYMAMHDSMTGLYNRQFFEAEFERLKYSRDFPIALIYLDLDNLKQTNDLHGHETGDALIDNTAEIIQKSIRRYDVAARIGGDEFVILVPKADTEVVHKIIGRFNKNTDDFNKKAKIKIKVSVGTAIASNKRQMIVKLHEADQKMYMQKREKSTIL